MIEQLPEEQNSFAIWIIGGMASGFLMLFGFIKWLIGIQVKKIDKLTEEVSAVKIELKENTTYDKNAKENMIRMQGEIKALNDKIDGQIVHAIQKLEENMKECEYCKVKKIRK